MSDVRSFEATGALAGAPPGRPDASSHLVPSEDASGAGPGRRPGRVLVGHLARAAALALTLGCCLVPQSDASAAAMTSAVYSDPVHWPLHVASYVDCTMTNPGCSVHHTFYGVDVIPTGQRNGNPASTAGVYSMGAGIAHIGDAAGTPCGTGSETNFGTWVWVDHGGGVVSRYGHLSRIEITEGLHVGAGQLLGVIGNTGDSSTLYCDENYLDFQVLADGYRGTSVPFSTKGIGPPDGDLLGCRTGTAQSWPPDLDVGADTIEAMPERTVVPASSDDCIPHLDVSSLPPAPTLTALSAGEDSVAASWPEVAGTDQIRVEFGRYHRDRKNYDSQWDERWTDLPGFAREVQETGLEPRTRHRLRVWFHTAAGGWQANTGFVSVSTG